METGYGETAGFGTSTALDRCESGFVRLAPSSMSRSRFAYVSLGLAATAAVGAGLYRWRPCRWWLLDHSILLRFPRVRRISTDELANVLTVSNPRPVLLDVRTDEEFAVSHIPGSRNIDPEEDAVTAVADLPIDAPIVTYCSVGWRSAKAASRLVEEGYTNVRNLEGSLFRWAGDGRTVVRNGQHVREVHPQAPRWENLLDPVLRAYRPGDAYD